VDLPLSRASRPWWDLLVVLLVIYSAFSLPVVLCFDVDTSATAGWDLFVDVVFYCDVVIYFFTAYGSETRDGNCGRVHPLPALSREKG